MNFEEYMRLPKRQRLTAKEIASRLRDRGYEITEQGVGYWKRVAVPKAWRGVLESILNESMDEAYQADPVRLTPNDPIEGS
jgi:hypothetical protein